MDKKEGRESRGSAPAEERVVGDGVAEDERSGRGGGDAEGGFAPRGAPRRTARTYAPDTAQVANFTGEQRLLLLDAWIRSKLPATEFAALVGVTSTTLYGWRKRFEDLGPGSPQERDTIRIMPLGEQILLRGTFEGPPLARDLRWIIVMGGVAVFVSWREGIRSGLVMWIGASCALLVFMHLNSYFARRRAAGVVRYPLCALAFVMAIAIVTLADQLIFGP